MSTPVGKGRGDISSFGSSRIIPVTTGIPPKKQVNFRYLWKVVDIRVLEIVLFVLIYYSVTPLANYLNIFTQLTLDYFELSAASLDHNRQFQFMIVLHRTRSNKFAILQHHLSINYHKTMDVRQGLPD